MNTIRKLTIAEIDAAFVNPETIGAAVFVQQVEDNAQAHSRNSFFRGKGQWLSDIIITPSKAIVMTTHDIRRVLELLKEEI